MTQAASQKIGSVLVVGGGIGGIQAALDLADSGYYVYLVEKSSSIGGTMAQLDKTFPTNDCAMCILGPKLVECSRHLNIENITYAELTDLSGEPGNFTAEIRKNPRYIDAEKCTGCADCADVCPVTAPSDFDEGLGERKAVFRPFPQAAPNVFAIEKKKEHRLCELSCPAGCDAQGYIALAAQGEYEEALRLIKETVPLPGVMGRICVHPCETNCRRDGLDAPVSVAGLKRFIADQFPESDIHPATDAEKREEKVAIVGSGPAGLSCAYYLALAGFQPTIFEAAPVPGGMLATGIPEYRLPYEVLEREIKAIEDLGVEIKTSSPIGGERTVDDLLGEGFASVFLAVGAQEGFSLDLPGEEADGVLQGVDFLREVNLLTLGYDPDGTPREEDLETGEIPPEAKELIGDHVAVIGGGNVAMDAARTALRLGAEKVQVIYRRSQREMPALREEVEAAIEEGVEITFLANPTQVLAENGQVTGLECVRMELGSPDSSGRRRPEPVPGSEFTVEVDTVLECIGQNVDLSVTEGSDIEDDGWTITSDPVTLETSREGVFAGGDAVTGPAIAVDALESGRRAAESIRRYLDEEDLRADREVAVEPDPALDELPSRLPLRHRHHPEELSVDRRLSSFDEVVLGFSEDTARQEAERCLDCAVCSECGECVRACQAEAVDHDQKPEIIEAEIGAVILSPGFDEFDPEELEAYSYGKSENVVTSIEFERILSASGPYGGELKRPGDGEHPHRIAWIQCIGSRDEQAGCGYCSSVCCTYAVKEAEIAKEHAGDELETTIFFMDMRTFGKDFDAYYERARDEYGVNFVRSRVHDVVEDEDGRLRVRYADEAGRPAEEIFDLVVLSVGLRPPKDAENLARTAGLVLDDYGFCAGDDFRPVATSREGIFACGAFNGPKDIPETVMQASAAAGEVSALLSEVRGTEIREKEYPEERNVEGTSPRIGVFVCHCGINIGGVVDVPAVRDYAERLPGVVFAEDNLYTCSQDTQELIKERINEYGLNRVIVASCTPRTHEPLFRETVREAGLNPYLFHMANIRDQCSWVHMHEPEAATEKAKDLVRAAIARAARLEPLPEIKIDIKKNVLVIGGGVAGMESALNLSAQGFEVDIVERESELGGHARRISGTLEGRDVTSYLKGLISRVEADSRITVHRESQVTGASGYVGNFISEITTPEGEFDLEHGAVIIATGGREYTPGDGEYGAGKHEGVITGRKLEEELTSESEKVADAEGIALIHCVGSRNEEHPYCSRICCSQQLKNAIAVKERWPDKDVFVLYRDIRAYGFKEEHYRRARQLGITFIRFDEDCEPEVSVVDGELQVTCNDPVLDEELELQVDLVVLGTGITPAGGAFELAQLYKVPLNDDGFFLEAHVKLRPVDFATDGVFLAGLAHAPKTLSESIAQAEAAASRATALLTNDQLAVEGWVSQVDPERCAGCEACVEICPYSATELNEEEGVCEVNEVLCKGCGACNVVCRAGAIDTRGFTNQQVLEEVDAACL